MLETIVVMVISLIVLALGHRSLKKMEQRLERKG